MDALQTNIKYLNIGHSIVIEHVYVGPPNAIGPRTWKFSGGAGTAHPNPCCFFGSHQSCSRLQARPSAKLQEQHITQTSAQTSPRPELKKMWCGTVRSDKQNHNP